MKQSRKRWSAEESEFVINNFEYMTDEEIGKELGRTANSVRHQRQVLKLYKFRTKKTLAKAKPVDVSKDINFKELYKLMDEKQSVILDLLDIQEERKDHDHRCECANCIKARQKERELVELNNRIRRARNIPPEGISFFKGVAT